MIRFEVHVHPGSRIASVAGNYDGALVVRVRARAVDGAATDEVVAALAEAFGVRANAVHCLRGARSRRKYFAIEGGDALRTRLEALLAN